MHLRMQDFWKFNTCNDCAECRAGSLRRDAALEKAWRMIQVPMDNTVWQRAARRR